MPESALERHSAVLAFRAHLGGSVMAWQALDDADARQYLVTRTREWLRLARISFSESVVEELSASQATKPAPVRAVPARAKATRAAKRRPRRSKSRAVS
jgi:hypothetical protein